MLKWLREHGCPWDASTCDVARNFKHPEVLQWALDNGCPPYVGRQRVPHARVTVTTRE